MQNGEPKRCGAKTKSGKPCRTIAMANGRCRLHGGKTPSGVANPNFKHGGYSKAMPKRLIASYEAGRADPDLISLRDGMALIDARVIELLGDLEKGGLTPEAMLEMRGKLAAFKVATAAKDNLGARQALAELEVLINDGSEEARSWIEIRQLLQEKRRLSSVELRRLVAAQQMLTAEQAVGLVASIHQLVMQHVTDPAQKIAIAQGLRQIINRGD